MRFAIARAVAATTLVAVSVVAAAPSVEIRDGVGRIAVAPQDRADVKVEMITTNASLPIEVSTVGGQTVIDGKFANRIRDGQGRGDHPTTWVRGLSISGGWHVTVG